MKRDDGVPTAPPAADELARIREAYARRAAADYGDRYSPFNPGNLFITQRREAALLKELRRRGFFPLHEKRILEVGCGTGYWLRQFVQWGADPARVRGVELNPDRAAEAVRLAPSINVSVGNAAATDFADSSFDIVLQSTVFTSILDPALRAAMAREMLRVLAPAGVIIWYDFRVDNPRNRDVRGIGRAAITALFPGCEITFQSVTLAPFLARRLAQFSPALCAALEAVPFLRTHILAFVSKPHAA